MVGDEGLEDERAGSERRAPLRRRAGRTCAALRLPYPREQLEAEIAALLASAGPVFTDMRLVLTRGGRRIAILEPYLE